MKNPIRCTVQQGRAFLVHAVLATGVSLMMTACEPTAAESKVRMTTSLGVMEIEMDAKRAPKTVENFLAYVDAGYFNGLIFHRVIPGFVLQGGGFEPGMKPRQTRAPIQNEADNGLKNTVGTLSMARTNDPHSATSQFFINLADNVFLDYVAGGNPGYAVFAQVVSGMEVMEKIAAAPTGNSGGHQDVPQEDILMISVERIK